MDATHLTRTPKIRFKKYTVKEFLEFVKDKPETERYELIGGSIYLMAAPNLNHQRLTRRILYKLEDFLDGKPCEPFIAPFDVVLFEKDESSDNSQNLFQPDLFVVCDTEKITHQRINGAPDFIIEVVSPSNSEHDYYYKCNLYMQYGVREYWIVNPETKNVLVHINGEKIKTHSYTFNDKIKANIFGDFEIDFKELQI